MPDYSKSKIYIIRCKTDPSLIYVDGTIQDLGICFSNHKRLSKKLDKPLYQLVNKKNWNYWYIELYEEYPCFCQYQLKRRTDMIRELLGNSSTVINLL